MVKWLEAVHLTIVREHEGIPPYVATDVEDVLTRLYEVREVLAHPPIPLVASTQTPADVLVVTDDAHGVLSDGHLVCRELHVY
jgi:hypothetical protein